MTTDKHKTDAARRPASAPPERRRIVVVLGMHRSGSSAITRGLMALGVDLGDNLMRPVEGNNVKGFWEDLDTNHFNERLLAKAKSAWHKLTPLDAAAFEGPAYSAERREAAGLLTRKLKPGVVFAFKDPRTAVLLPFWRCVFEDLDLDVRYLVTVRNPLESAASLLKRDGFPMAKGATLWAKHLIEAVRATEGERRVFVAFDRLLRDPEGELLRIAAALDLPAPGETALAEFRDDFLEAGLRHNIVGAKELARSGLAAPFVIDLYEILSGFAEATPERAPTVDADAWRAIETGYAQAAPLLGYADAIDETRAAAEGQVKTLDAKLKETGDALQKAAADRQALDKARAELEERLRATTSELERLRASNAEEVGLLTEAKQKAEARIAELRQEIETLRQAEIDARQKAEAQIARLENDVESLRRAAAAAEAQHSKAVDAITGEKDRAVREAAASIGKLAAERDRQAAAAKALEARLAAETDARRKLESAAAAGRAERAALRKDVLLLRAEANAVRRSTSWRLTAPIRALGLVARNPVGGGRKIAAGAARRVWRLIPLSPAKRGKIAGALFRSAPFLFGWSGAYKAWRAERDRPDFPAPPAGAMTRFRPAAAPDLDGPVPLAARTPPARLAARALAFYLPQFHPIPENDAWWGEGFTEWTKVRPASPKFEGHYQPHEPGELGAYDLLKDDGVMARQAELARLHGLSGFAFYFYWFAGKTLLEAPLRKWLASPEIDFPFCLVWANENWSRRWDGAAHEILIAQDHSPSDDLAFIDHIADYLRDPRYFRIDGRPLLVVYRPALLPDAASTAKRWRDRAREIGLGDIYLAYTQSFERVDPATIGFDAAIEFPPNNMGLVSEPALVTPTTDNFSLKIYDWTKMAARSAAYVRTPYRIFRGVTPSWDNTPRRPNDGAVFVGATPQGYLAWLRNAVADTAARISEPEERLVFINAWNEWAEGAHLEPDQRHGYAWLEATRRALDADHQARRVIVVAHDMHRHGAQYLSLNIARTLKTRHGAEVAILAGAPGDLAPQFAALGPLRALDGPQSDPEAVDAAVADLVAQGFTRAIVNSAAAGWLAPFLARHGVRMVGLVHELPSVISAMKLESGLRAFDQHAAQVVFASAVVRDKAARAAGLNAFARPVIDPQGLYKVEGVADLAEKARAKRALAAQAGFSPDDLIVLGVGFADHRKAPDIFIDWAEATLRIRPDAQFIWVGDVHAGMRPVIDKKRAALGDAGARIRFVGFDADTKRYYQAADLYALTSREDPFPSTALEALAAAAPVVMISGAGGIEDLAPSGAVRAAEGDGGRAFTAAAGDWLHDAEARTRAGIAGRDLIRARFGFSSYVGRLADAIGLGVPSVSVVVPNYNYARYLPQRLASILAQTLSPREIIVLDDASTDDSVRVIEETLRDCPVDWRLVRNETNAGDVFAQWRKGVELARGDLVWIAEADDWAEPRFLETAARAFADARVVLSFTQSQQADAEGRITAPDYHDYVKDVSAAKWTEAFTGDGVDEVRAGFAVKNTIPNVSGALFRRAPLADVLAQHRDVISGYRVAGDWCVYVELLRNGRLAFDPEPLNIHRRHDASVTISRFGLADLAEIARMQAHVAETFGLDATARAAQGAYLDALVRHFDLAGRFDAAALAAARAGKAPDDNLARAAIKVANPDQATIR